MLSSRRDSLFGTKEICSPATSQLEDLRIENLAGYGQAHYTSDDFVQLANYASKTTKRPLSVLVVWRPEDEYVTEPWRQWNYAHVQVETVKEDTTALRVYRQQLSLNARLGVPPASE